MTGPKLIPPVWKSVDLPCSADLAFDLFTRQPTQWWPHDHRLAQERQAVVFEPFLGGRWYERDSDGAERDWGRVLEWEHGRRLRLSWLIDGSFAPIDDDALASRVSIVFGPLGPASTLVSIGHVDLHRHGPAAAAIRSVIDGPSPGDTLGCFARWARAVRAPRTT
ncbi:hypothetical protein [Streptomyces sp. NPDC057966]|uniref:hypothetical protein n=1 Tax=Streptomyces sp. NPDC057966 TaxID=3346292 RepID=UPI0036F052F8